MEGAVDFTGRLDVSRSSGYAEKCLERYGCEGMGWGGWIDGVSTEKPKRVENLHLAKNLLRLQVYFV